MDLLFREYGEHMKITNTQLHVQLAQLLQTDSCQMGGLFERWPKKSQQIKTTLVNADNTCKRLTFWLNFSPIDINISCLPLLLSCETLYVVCKDCSTGATSLFRLD